MISGLTKYRNHQVGHNSTIGNILAINIQKMAILLSHNGHMINLQLSGCCKYHAILHEIIMDDNEYDTEKHHFKNIDDRNLEYFNISSCLTLQHDRHRHQW
jgi:hypothetical protein